MKTYRGVAAATLVAHLFTISQAHAYGRQTHQRVTELAFGIMKQMERCQPSEAAVELIKTCQEGCDANNYEKDVSKGLSLAILRTQCKESCLDSFAVMGPNDDMMSESEISEEMKLLGLDARYCRLYEPVYAKYKDGDRRKLQPSTSTSRNSRYFQIFRSPACPDQMKYTHKQDENCAKYNLLESDGGFNNGEPFYRLLSSHTRAQYGGKLVVSSSDSTVLLGMPGAKYTHLPMIGPNLTYENYVDGTSESIIDYTGTILGYYSGSTDLFEDVYTEIKILPLVWDVTKTLIEGTAVAVGTTAAVLWAVGAVIVCSVSCVLKRFGANKKCEECFSNNYSNIKDYAESIQDAIRDVEETNLTSLGDGTSSFGNHNSSLSHFMNSPIDYQNALNVGASLSLSTPPSLFDVIGLFFDHDDVDGYRLAESIGPVGGGLAGAFEGLYLDQLVDMRVNFGKSKPTLLNYQIMEPDDGMDASSSVLNDPLRNVFYWHRQGMTDYTFAPIDNLAYYWWHKWWEARTTPQPANAPADQLRPEEELGLVPLGAVLHAVQDITQPLHARGISAHGHWSYEAHLEEFMDQALFRLMNEGRSANSRDLVLDLEDPVYEQIFVTAVIAEFVRMNDEFVTPTGVLQIRPLMHDLYRSSIELSSPLGFISDDNGPVVPFLSAYMRFEISDEYTRDTGLVKATAATLLILLEASTTEVSAYEQALDLATFENFTVANKLFEGPDGTYNRLETHNQALQQTPLSLIDEPDQVPSDWACASTLPFAKVAVEDFVNDRITGREMLEKAMSAQIQCSIMEAGLPVPPFGMMESMGKYKARQIELYMQLLQDGDVARHERDLACAQLDEWETETNRSVGSTKLVVPELVYGRVQAQCQGMYDADADGIVDDDDHCFTPPELLQGPVQLGSDGCLFEHDYVVGQRPVTPFVKSAIYAPGGTP